MRYFSIAGVALLCLSSSLAQSTSTLQPLLFTSTTTSVPAQRTSTSASSPDQSSSTSAPFPNSSTTRPTQKTPSTASSSGQGTSTTASVQKPSTSAPSVTAQSTTARTSSQNTFTSTPIRNNSTSANATVECPEVEIQYDPIQCAGQNLTITSFVRGTMANCTNMTYESHTRIPLTGSWNIEDGALRKVVKEIRACPMVCVAQKLGIMDFSGNVNTTLLNSMMNDTFPFDLLENVKLGITECVEGFNSNTTMNSTTEDCSSYNDLFDCTSYTIEKVCNWVDN